MNIEHKIVEMSQDLGESGVEGLLNKTKISCSWVG